MMLNNLNYPLDFKFKITTLSSDFNITDRNGNYVCYVRQKMFRLKEDVVLFSDESRSTELYRIKANQWIDFNASYSITENNGNSVGVMARAGMKSLWRSTYQVMDNSQQDKFTISEKNAWIKVWDGLVSEIPVIGMLSGYFLNPSYEVKDQAGKVFFELKKMPSLIGRRFQLQRLVDISDEDETLVVLSLLMMVLLERSKG